MNTEYILLLSNLKSHIRSTQIKAALAVNAVLIKFYWELGQTIIEKQTAWGSKFIETLSKDLQSEFPEMKGFSKRNLLYCVAFYKLYANDQEVQIVQQSVAQLKNDTIENKLWSIPWGHHVLIINKCKEPIEAKFYVQKTIENNWSRSVLDLQIKNTLYQRQGKLVHNFEQTLPNPFSELAVQTLKDPYIFDFLTLDSNYREKDIENQLIENIAKFLLELGKGFAFVGQQYHLSVAENDYYLDLLFYHIRLKCYVVIELKNTKFIPEYSGKLNFYLSAVDTLIKDSNDNATIGLLICKSKNNLEAEFALRDLNKPIGISEFELTTIVPEELKSSLPTIEELELEISKFAS